MVPLNTPFDPWPWRRRVLATAAAAAALTVVIAALVTAPPDSPQGMAAPPGTTSASQTQLPGTDGTGADKPAPSGDPTSPEDDDEKTDPAKTGDGDDDKDDDDDPPPPPPAHVTKVSVPSVGQTCSGLPDCLITATVNVSAYDKRQVTVSVTIANANGSGGRTYTYNLSGSKSYTVSVPGGQGSYKTDWACGSGNVVVTAGGDGKSGSNDAFRCPR
ncbi:hypothetical protein AB0I28_18890 [Phytomonospora sp. NPDC050363]|uniref:hypothetical protein n=1 Tax=Phytomonospora sp. NPDC050363 TaxID=3155642 RepID=UPI0033E1FC18